MSEEKLECEQLDLFAGEFAESCAAKLAAKRARRAEYMREYNKRNIEKKREWAKRNNEKDKASHKKSRERNGHKYKARIHRYNTDPKNAARASERSRAWRLANRERVNEIALQGYYRDVEKGRAKCRAWKKANPEKTKASTNDSLNRRRARMAGNGLVDPDTKPFTRIVKLIASYYCTYCETWIDGVPTIDHVMPIARGGGHVMSNLALACLDCNQSKSASTPEEFAQRKRLRCIAA